MQTVEVIACVLRHKCPHPSHPRPLAARIAALPKQPRINCITCGTVADNPHDDVAESYRGMWVQCDGCASWMHGTCISYRGQPDKLVCGECLRRLSQQVRHLSPQPALPPSGGAPLSGLDRR